MSPGDHDPNAVAGGQLARRLGTFDATVIGLGSMLGAGVFAVFAPAAAAAGEGMLVALALAGVVAYCNATSSAQLATVHPTSGGTYVYGREQLGHWWGFVAGWGFVVGKTASCAAMAMTFATYVAPGFERPLALAWRRLGPRADDHLVSRRRDSRHQTVCRNRVGRTTRS